MKGHLSIYGWAECAGFDCHAVAQVSVASRHLSLQQLAALGWRWSPSWGYHCPDCLKRGRHALH